MTAAQRCATVVGGVIRQALADADARLLVLLDDGSPEALLARDWCAAELGANFVALAHGAAIARQLAGAPMDGANARVAAPDAWVLAEEARRLEARLRARTGESALLANPANKTALLLGSMPPPEPLLPLGDLFATDVLALAGGWSAPPPVRALAELVGGIEALDGALRAHFDERRPVEEAVAGLPAAARGTVLEAISAARFARRRMGLVPKLGPRTLGLDLFG